MKIRCLSAVVSLLLMYAVAAPAVAGVSPYVRCAYGGGAFRMTDVDGVIKADQKVLNHAGIVTEFQRVGSGYGPSVSAGVWVVPGLRVGATYAYHRARVQNQVDLPVLNYYYDDVMEFRMSEIGVEAAVRFASLAGLTVGGNVAQGRGEFDETFTLIDGAYYQSEMNAHRTKPTFGGFVGLDQTNSQGLAGYIHAGFAYRDHGRMDGNLEEFDGSVTTHTKTKTTWMDYTGLYLRVGVGFDLVR